MNYVTAIRDADQDPQQLETLFQTARKENGVEAFTADLETCYHEANDNMLYAAWHYRLEAMVRDERAERRGINWKVALPVSLAAGLALWLLSEPTLRIIDQYQVLGLYGIPLTILFALALMGLSAGQSQRRYVLAGIGLIAAFAYVPLIVAARDAIYRGHYADLMTSHLPVLAWAAVGIGVLGMRSPAGERFAFLLKSFEVLVTAGLFLIGGVIFAQVTLSLFWALDIQIPDAIQRLLIVGVLGPTSLLALASAYDPKRRPLAQDFRAGLARLLATLARLLLLPTLLVLALYIFALLSNFEGPFKDRDVLGIYHAMLFAVIGLLIGATPIQEGDLPARFRSALRAAIIGTAGLAALVGLYTLAAIVYRTINDTLTMNRLTLIGWDVINVGILATLINRQYQLGRQGRGWVEAAQSAFALGAVGYALWALFVILAVPIIIR
ncbi:MAG TPA: hypothetical protein VJG32_00275 [Anaerolineae bacterium]|nr:hypothetical protein [Anaerolineae bacterium]